MQEDILYYTSLFAKTAATTNKKQKQNKRRWQMNNKFINPLESRGNYSATANKYEVGTLAVDGWAVTFGTARRGLTGP